MSDAAMISTTQIWLRRAAFAFAGVVATHAIWLLAAELVHPAQSHVRVDATAATARRAAATLAARIGLVRGDLWAECALSYADLIWAAGHADDATSKEIEQEAHAVAATALAHAPHDARVWLLLAGLASRFRPADGNVAELLKMSYYTGPSEVELIPHRLLAIVRSRALGDSDLQQFVLRDARIIVKQKPELKPAIVTAYREASEEEKRILEGIVGELDPHLLTSIRSGGEVR